MQEIIQWIAQELKKKPQQIEAVLQLLEEGNTVPFIARYRKERTNGLDEEEIRVIQEAYQYQENLKQRKEDVLRLIETKGHLTDALKEQILGCKKLSEVEDLYRPYQEKRKTRASDAIAKGLQPFADWLLKNPSHPNYLEEANKYLNDKVSTVEEAIQGAKDIIAEICSDNVDVRNQIRSSMQSFGVLTTKEKKTHDDTTKTYKMYYDYHEKLKTIAPHRIMAIDRGEKEKVLQVSISYSYDYDIEWVKRYYIKKRDREHAQIVEEALEDGLKRLLIPSVEREFRKELSEKAQEQAIHVFSFNLERLLLQAPMKGKVVLGFDPAFRTGCKLAIVDANGALKKIAVIYPHPPVSKQKEAQECLVELVRTYHVDIIAIGNGTASRESEVFVAECIKKYQLPCAFTMVSEAGASVYSASKLAKDEFPDLQVEQRSAISIARRVIDPLSELIKIDPQSIGVGQYQHDVANHRLKDRLSFVVTKAVNRVGVNLNTASVELLKQVSGLNNATAKSIVEYRNQNGSICCREQLKKIPKIGAKSFQQAAGFLRVEESDEWMDKTAIHPESYDLAKKIMNELQISEQDIGKESLKETLSTIDFDALVTKFQSDLYTIQDIIDAMKQPLRDFRDQYDAPLLRSDILEIEDLKIGDCLEGVVRNVVDFGVFVDIGLHEDALIHVSKLSKQRRIHPSQVVSVGDILSVYVYEIDKEREKVSLSMWKEEV